ncbi:ankyrin repeat domain-containing protein 26-like [Anas acuta]|uniref:ankyrin repeat domain-containing protein 26-like n=1 Tax=Anas acuta TaxID=28680 RepID=UPI0035C93DB6
MIRLLLRHGADPFQKDFSGKSAKDYFKDLNEILEEAASSVIPGESPADAAKGTAVPEGSCPVTTDYMLLLSTEYDEFGDEGEDGGFNAEGSAKEEENLPQRQDPETRLHFRDNTQGSAKEEENLPQRQDPETRLHFRDNTQGSAKEEENLPQRQDPETRLHFRDNTQGVVRQLPQELPGAPEEQPKSKAPLEDPMHHHGRLKEEKRRLQKELYKYKAKLLRSQQQYIERLNYGVGLQIAIEKMEREVTASCVKQQSVLVASAAAAVIKHLEERVQRLEAQNARLEATAQQQAMIIEALQKELQASASSPPNCQSAVMR